ncbi:MULTISPECIES: DcaP family trimeric outer membrane transporter [Shewanella]|jgi:hypothetical protein|uniref:Porin n=1 Tax=Shewanella psychromarinicola TaxID=2487742 RepID=A0A3N4DA14_9GAMM|nr:DcaP family trimeric outer membrane transporter [Shewanella psychromarinicola]AZG35771.1 hypothetical protein EGC80_13355 [Shewanella psychromarinicola]MCL1084178.1 DcaP family trimeric outer membrane transporter [Shewanella psychromarinicola]RPA22549.1 hypothetical protein EGC77_21635 [Shewanella psychromarinicola]
MNIKISLPLTLLLTFLPTPTVIATEYELGGFIKTNARYVDGTIAFQPSWNGDGSIQDEAKRTQFGAQESRFNLKLTQGDVSGFVEIDFVGSSQGNPVISNSYSPRVRHAMIQYEAFTAGQTWSTLVNTSTFAETADLGGPLVGQAMVRQALLRYQTGHWQVALENPYTYGTQVSNSPEQTNWIETSNDYVPDAIIRYDQQGHWGNVSLSGLVRYLDPSETAQLGLGGSLAAKINTFGKDDLRLQLHYGNLGRYVGTDAAKDIIQGEIETTSSAMLAYRHFWSETTRSTIFYGHTRTQVEQTDRSHFGVNLFTNLTPALKVGVELGHYQISDNQYSWSNTQTQTGQSHYAQFTLQFHI